MDNYKAPALKKIEIQSGVSFASYPSKKCPPSFTDIVVSGVCTNPVQDKDYGGGYYCYISLNQ